MAWPLSSPAVAYLQQQVDVFGLIIAEVALVMYISGRIDRMALTTATLMFTLYSALNGMTLASIFVLYSEAIITKRVPDNRWNVRHDGVCWLHHEERPHLSWQVGVYGSDRHHHRHGR